VLRVGIIGCGGAGQAHWTYFSSIPGCHVTKILDPRPAGLVRATALSPEIMACSNEEVFWSDLDAVSVCSPDSTHADYIITALDRGLHVLCEKPLTASIDDVRRIVEAERTSDRVVAVLHQMRFVPVHRRIKELLESRQLGTLSYLEGYYVHNLTERAFRYDDWRKTENATPLVYSGCHFVDILRWFAGDEIVEIYTAANNLAFPAYPESDLNVVTLRFASGIIGKVVVAFGAAGPQDHSVRLYGDRGCIENNVLFGPGGRWEGTIARPILIPRKLVRSAGTHRRLKDCVRTMRQIRANLGACVIGGTFEALRHLAPSSNPEYASRFYPVRLYEHGLACIEAVEDFVDAIAQSRPPQCTVDDASQVVLACLAGVESYRTNLPVAVPSLDGLMSLTSAGHASYAFAGGSDPRRPPP
jgi:UDP-N-acetylglucosamine 3-dehydrogenase